MATTTVGPISVPQVNNTYYVGEAFLATIQQAVTFAVANGAGTVIIPQAYAGSDSIAAVTGGSATVYITDERHGQRQSYLWLNNAYVYLSIHALGGVLTPQLNGYAYVGFGVNQTIQGVIDSFAARPTLYITIIIEPSYTGGEFIEDLTGGDPGIVLSDQRTAQWQNYEWDGTHFVASDFVPLGKIIAGAIEADSVMTTILVATDTEFDTCIVDNSPVRTFANTADSPSQGMIWPEFGIPVSQGNHWQDPSIDPATIPRLNTANTFTGLNAIASVAVSTSFVATMNNGTNPPVVAPSNGLAIGWNSQSNIGETDFINSHAAGGGGFNWYNVGAGTIVNPSVQPIMKLDGVGGLSLAGSLYGQGLTSELIAGPVGSDPRNGTAGLPLGRLVLSVLGQTGVSFPGQFNFNTFSAMTPSSSGDDTLTLTHLSAGPDGNSPVLWSINRAGNMTVVGSVIVNSGSFWEMTSFAHNGLHIGPRQGSPAWLKQNPSISSDGNALVLNPGAGQEIYLNWDQGSGVIFGNGSEGQAASIDNGGNATFGHVTSGNIGFTAGSGGPRLWFDGGSSFLDGAPNGRLLINNTPGAGSTCIVTGEFSVSGTISQSSVIRIGNRASGGWTSGSPNINSDGQNLYINPQAGGSLVLNFDEGQGVIFGSGSGVQVANVDLHGNAVFNGTLTAGTKSFRIAHPLDATKDLNHSCLEGPEIAVFYRGETQTVDGWTEVTLPDYFEALTRAEDRTVQLTQTFDNDAEVFSRLMASPVKGGKFKIRSSEPTAKVFWEVKAVRADVAALIVTTEKEKSFGDPPIESIPITPTTDAGADRDRAPEAREPKPKKVRS